MRRLSALALFFALFALAGCEDSSVASSGEQPVEYQIDLQDDWPLEGSGFRLRVHVGGTASLQELRWDARARIIPAPIVPIGRLSAAERATIDELFQLELPQARLMAPEAPPIYPSRQISWAAVRKDPPHQRNVSRLYEQHVPTLPAELYRIVDALRRIHGEEPTGDWESDVLLQQHAWSQNERVIGAARFVYRGEQATQLVLPTSCQAERTLIDAVGNEYPELIACLTVITELPFDPGQGRAYRMDFDAFDPPDGWPTDEKSRLAVGDYTLRVRLGDLVAETALQILPSD